MWKRSLPQAAEWPIFRPPMADDVQTPVQHWASVLDAGPMLNPRLNRGARS